MDLKKTKVGFFTTARLIQDLKAIEPNKFYQEGLYVGFSKKAPIILLTNQKSYNTKFQI